MPVYKDKESNTWMIRTYIDGRQIKRRGFETRQAAQREEAKLLIEKPKRRITFSAMYESYLENVSHDIKETVIQQYRRYYTNFYEPFFKDPYIDTIKYKKAQQFRNSLDTKGYSVNYKNNILIVIKQAFNWALKMDYLQDNPFSLVKTFKKNAKHEMDTYTLDEFNAFVSAISDQRAHLIFDTLYWTGIRISELRGLRWTDIDLKNKTLTIDHQIYKGKEITPKSLDSNRTIDLDDQLTDELKAWKKAMKSYDGFSSDWFVFGSLTPIGQHTIQYWQAKGEELSGTKHIRIHDFRHSHASLLLAEGFSVVYVSKRLGHSSPSITMDVYAHVLDSLRNKEKSRLNKLKTSPKTSPAM